MTTPPFTHRIAFPPEASFHLYQSDDWYAWLQEIGYNGIFLSPDPRKPRRTAEFCHFRTEHKLVNLWDFARSPDRNRMRDWVAETCERAHRHDLKVYLATWEPKLPIQAWGHQPPEWMGRGSYTEPPFDIVGWCLSHPDAAEDYKAMAKEGFDSLPGLNGVVAGSIDNEAFHCTDRCSRCSHLSRNEKLTRFYKLYNEALADRGDDFDFVLYTWWWSDEEKMSVADVLSDRKLTMLGRSTIDLPQHLDGEVIGHVDDLALAPRGLSMRFEVELDLCRHHEWKMTDMTVFGHAFEYFFLPYTPAPEAVANRLNVLHEAGAAGWFDYDCGGVHPGINTEIIRDWLTNPTDTPDQVTHTIHRLFANQPEEAKELYATCDRALLCYPYGLRVSTVQNLNGRNLNGLTLAIPFAPESITGLDQGHRSSWMDPANLITRESTARLIPMLTECAKEWRSALEQSTDLTPIESYSDSFDWEKKVIEMHALATESLCRYAQLGKTVFSRCDGEITEDEEAKQVRQIQEAELEATRRAQALVQTSPRLLLNPVWRIEHVAQVCWMNDVIDHQDPLGSKIEIMERLIATNLE